MLITIKGLKNELGPSKYTIYNRIKAGLLTCPIKLGDRAVGWQKSEINEVLNAHISKKNRDDIRCLVKNIEARRFEGKGVIH